MTQGGRHPDYIRAVLDRAVALIDGDLLDTAEALLATLAEERAVFDTVAYLRGIIAARLGQPDLAQHFLKAALVENPRNAEAHGQLGLLLLASQPAAAAAAFAAALALQGGRVDWLAGLAETLDHFGYEAFARDCLDEARALSPDHAAVATLSSALQSRDEPRGEIAALTPQEEAIFCDALFAEAARHQGQNDVVRARAMLERVLERAPAHALALYHLAVLERGQGDDARALALLERALAAEPGLVAARLALAELHAAADRAADARAQFEAAIEAEPRNAAAHAAFAMALQTSGAASEAITHFHAAILIDQNQPAAFYAALGAALEAMGLRERADIALGHARALARA